MKKHRLLVAVTAVAISSGVVFADSLYREASYKPLVGDYRARNVGDNLTVIVTEFASVTANARTTTDKDGTVAGTLQGTNSSKNGSINLNENFNGGGKIERSGKLTAQLTVVVQSIEPNGDLHVKGQQEISVNNEVQTLIIEGRVRPQDIGADNTIPSTRLSDSKISYTGDGLLAEKQKPGILTRFLSWLRLL